MLNIKTIYRNIFFSYFLQTREIYLASKSISYDCGYNSSLTSILTKLTEIDALPCA